MSSLIYGFIVVRLFRSITFTNCYSKNYMGQTLMHLAAASGNVKVIEILKNAEVSIHAVDFHNETPLHLAAKNGKVDAVKMLIRAAQQDPPSNNRDNLFRRYHTHLDVAIETGQRYHDSAYTITIQNYDKCVLQGGR